MKLMSKRDDSSGIRANASTGLGAGIFTCELARLLLKVTLRGRTIIIPVILVRTRSQSHLERLGNLAEANGDEPGFEPIRLWMRLSKFKVCSKPLRESVLEP